MLNFSPLVSRIQNCGFHICPDGMSCCKKCDTKGNVYPTGQCVDTDNIDSDCLIDHCENNTLIHPRLNIESIKTDGQEKTEYDKCKYFKLILMIYFSKFSKRYNRLFSFI